MPQVRWRRGIVSLTKTRSSNHVIQTLVLDLVRKPHQEKDVGLASSSIGKLDYVEVGRGHVDHDLPLMSPRVDRELRDGRLKKVDPMSMGARILVFGASARIDIV
jgi:hypothetical protein